MRIKFGEGCRTLIPADERRIDCRYSRLAYCPWPESGRDPFSQEKSTCAAEL